MSAGEELEPTVCTAVGEKPDRRYVLLLAWCILYRVQDRYEGDPLVAGPG
jgi:hypothetical protein